MRLFSQTGGRRKKDTPRLTIRVSTERPPLTPEQIAFLRKPVSAIVTRGVEAVWLATAPGCRTVFDVAVLIVHMRYEVRDPGALPPLRAAIEAVVGPLPLQLTHEELSAICSGMSRGTFVGQTDGVEGIEFT